MKLFLILISAAIFAYFSSLGNPFIWDDEQFITSNVYVQTFDIAKIFTTNTVAGAGIVSNYYRPLSSLSFAMDAKMWGQNPFGFHLTNLFFHLGAGLFLFLLLSEAGIGQWGSFCVSLFFLIHPVQVEAVSYINSRGDSMYACFLFASLLFFTQGIKTKKWKWLTWSLVAYILSILSKETAIAAFPLFFVLILIHVFNNRQNFAQSIQLYTKPILIAFVSVLIVAVYWLMRLTTLNFGNTLNYYTVQDVYSTHLWIRLLTFAKVVWVYIGLLLWPYPLHMERNVSLVISLFDWHVWGILLLTLGVLILAFWEIRTKRSGIIFFGFCISACLLLPVSGIIPINGILYEHWLYMPMVGFWVMLYGIVSFLFFQKWEGFRKYRVWKNENLKKILLSFGILLCILYIVLTIRQNNIWSDPITFYSYTLQFAPNSARLHNNLGMSLADTGNARDAIVEYKKALHLGEGYPQIYNNLGNAEIKVGDYKDAEIYLEKALQIAPQFGVAKNNLIKLYLVTKQFDKALKISENDPKVKLYIEQMREK